MPSHCDTGCRPVWESFFTRCQTLIRGDPNRLEFAAFQSICHPASVDTSDTLFSDDFESGLGKWRGQSAGSSPETATIEDEKGNKVLKMNGCKGGGDAFSTDAFECSAANPCLVSYKTKGRAWQGFSADFPGSHIWSATPSDYEGQHIRTDHHNAEWQHVEYVFPVGFSTFGHDGDYTLPITQVHLILEGFDFDCEQTMFDDFEIKRYTGSAEQAAAVNNAIQPANPLFTEDFESGSMGWHGKGTNERPETAIIMEDPDGNHGFVMAMTDCVGGGDAFGRETFECSTENKCLVSYYIKGRAWQGFAEGYPGNHIWTAAPDENYPGVHLQTVHDTGNWHHVEYVFPVNEGNFVHGDDSTPIGDVHMMFEGFDEDCTQTFIDDISVTRFSGSEESAAGINRAANANVDILFEEHFPNYSGDEPVGVAPNHWAGQGGPPNAPSTAVIADDPQHGHVLAMQSCASGVK